MPELTASDLRRRWRLESYETVKRILAARDVKPVNKRSGTGAVYSLADILRCEGVAEPDAAWALGDDDARAVLEAPLRTAAERGAADRRLSPLHERTYRRRAVAGADKDAVRIGKAWRWRPTLEEARRALGEVAE